MEDRNAKDTAVEEAQLGPVIQVNMICVDNKGTDQTTHPTHTIHYFVTKNNRVLLPCVYLRHAHDTQSCAI